MARALCLIGLHRWVRNGSHEVCVRRWCRGRTWRTSASESSEASSCQHAWHVEDVAQGMVPRILCGKCGTEKPPAGGPAVTMLLRWLRCPHAHTRCIHGDEILHASPLWRNRTYRQRCLDCGRALDLPLSRVCTGTGQPHYADLAGQPPEQVPDDLVTLGAQELLGEEVTTTFGYCVASQRIDAEHADHLARVAMAAVLPEHRRRVLAEAAALFRTIDWTKHQGAAIYWQAAARALDDLAGQP